MRRYKPKITIYTVSEGEYDILFLEHIFNLYGDADKLFFKAYPRGDMPRGKPSIIRNLGWLRSMHGKEYVKYFGIYDGDNSRHDLISEDPDFALIKVEKCLEFLLLKVLGVNECNDYTNSVDIKKYFQDQFAISNKSSFKGFLKNKLTKDVLNKKTSVLKDLKNIIGIFT